MQFKDAYKRRNAELEKENEQLRFESDQLFSPTINERDSRILELESSERNLKQRVSSLDAQCRSDNCSHIFLVFSYVFSLLLSC